MPIAFQLERIPALGLQFRFRQDSVKLAEEQIALPERYFFQFSRTCNANLCGSRTTQRLPSSTKAIRIG